MPRSKWFLLLFPVTMTTVITIRTFANDSYDLTLRHPLKSHLLLKTRVILNTSSFTGPPKTSTDGPAVKLLYERARWLVTRLAINRPKRYRILRGKIVDIRIIFSINIRTKVVQHANHVPTENTCKISRIR